MSDPLPSKEDLVAELEAAAAKWVLEKNKYTLESLRDARAAVLKRLAPETFVQPSNLALQKGADVLWGRQFKGTPWEGKVGLINPDSMEEYRALAFQVWKAINEPPANPLAHLRWICIHCSTVSGVDDPNCLGCRKPRYPHGAALKANEHPNVNRGSHKAAEVSQPENATPPPARCPVCGTTDGHHGFGCPV